MISGAVDAELQAAIRLIVLGERGRQREVTAVIDTGYSGSLSLAPDVVATLDLPFSRRGRAILADGSQIVFDVYQATVIWDAVRRPTTVDVVDADPLIGMALLAGHRLTVDVVPGGSVRIAVIEPPVR